MKEKSIVNFLFFLTSMLVFILLTNKAFSETEKECRKKTEFIVNLQNLVTWPEERFAVLKNNNKNICVIGKDSFSETFKEIFLKNLKGNCRCADISNIQNCNILFIHDSEKDRLEKIFDIAKKNNILTVSEIKNFADMGGMISFDSNANNKIKLRINYLAAKEAKLKLNAKLLKIAKVLYREEN